MNAMKLKMIQGRYGEDFANLILSEESNYLDIVKQKGTRMKHRITTKTTNRYKQSVDELIECATTIKQMAEAADDESTLDLTAENAKQVADACAIIMPHVGKGTQQALEALIASMQTIQGDMAQKSRNRHTLGWIEPFLESSGPTNNDYTRPITNNDIERAADEYRDQLIAEAASYAVMATTKPSKLRAKQVAHRRESEERQWNGWDEWITGDTDMRCIRSDVMI